MARIGSILSFPKGNKFYVDLGIFTLFFIAYLWIAPKLIKKPAGTPPRSGSNEETQQANRTAQGQAPEAVGAPGTAPTPPNQSGIHVSPMGSGTSSGISMPAGSNTLGNVPLSSTSTASMGTGNSPSISVPLGGAYRARASAFPGLLSKISYQ